jgi:hypothetical protein
MRELTQTVFADATSGRYGNCWQTCIACLLDIDPGVMPPQEEYDWCRTEPDGETVLGPGYLNVLQDYLRVHHDLGYVGTMHLPVELFPLLRVADPGWHLMSGRTVRSEACGGLRHVVVGRYGQMVWDPHPSRAGLVEDIHWAFLVPYPRAWRRPVERPCVCPSCAAGRVPGRSGFPEPTGIRTP